jgi:hypothetical protein
MASLGCPVVDMKRLTLEDGIIRLWYKRLHLSFIIFSSFQRRWLSGWIYVLCVEAIEPKRRGPHLSVAAALR